MAGRVLLEDKTVDIDGEIVTYVKGTSESEIKNDIQSRTGGFLSALGSGVENLKGSLGNIPAVGIGDVFENQALLDRAGKGYEESVKAQRESLPLPTTYKDVLSTYEEEGLFPAIGTAGRFSAESIGQTIPYSLPALFAGKAASSSVGLGIASKLAKAVPFLRTAGAAIPHPVLRMGLGAAAGIGTLAIQFFGDNMQRQYEVAEEENEGESKVTPDQLNSFAAALAAAPQAAMDYIVIALTGGIGRGPQIAAARSLKQSLSATATGKAIPTVGQAARASFAESALEFPTELTQTILERAQAGLSISPENIDFIEEMIATAAGTLPVVGAFGSYGTVRSYRANKRAQAEWDKGTEDELRIRSSSDDKRAAILQDQFDAANRMQKENTAAYEAKVAASGRSRAEFDAEVDQEALIADDVIDTALSRNILTDNDAFKAFVYRSTGGRTDVLEDASKKELRAMKSVLSGFSVQAYFDPATEKGVSLPSFTSEEFEAVTDKLKANKKLTPDIVRELLNKKLYPKIRGVEAGSEQERESLLARRENGEFIVNYSATPASIGIANSIIEEMVYRGMAIRDAKGNVKSRKTGYTEKQYRTLIDRASLEGSINRSDFEEITRNFKEKAFDSFINDSIVRGDLPKRQDANQTEGEYSPLVFWGVTDEEFSPAQTQTGAPKIRGGGVRGRAVTVGNVQTERIDNVRGYFVRDEDGTIVGGATSKAEAAREAAGLNELRGRWETTDENGNVTTGLRKRLDLTRARLFGELKGVGPKKVAGFFEVDTSPSEGFLVRQSVTPAVWRKDRETGEIVSEDAPRTGPSRNPPVHITFAPDQKTADAVVNQFAEESSPGFPSAEYDSRREAKAAELRPLWEADKRLFTPPAEADVLQSEGLTRPEEISSKEQILKAIPETSRAKGEEVLKIIENKLKEANIDKKVTAKVVERIGTSGIGAEGRYSPVLDGFRNIAISMNAIKDAKTNEEIRIAVASIMDHEMIHAMRELDLFTIQEWRVLSGAVSRVKNKDGKTFLEAASKRYSGMKGYETHQSIVEEAVAEMYRGYYSDPEVRRQISGQPRTLLERIAMFAEKLYNALQGAGFVSAADVISGMKKIQARETGAVGEAREIRTLKGVEAQAEYNARVLVGAEQDQDQGEQATEAAPEATTPRDYNRREYYETGERIDVFQGLDADRFVVNGTEAPTSRVEAAPRVLMTPDDIRVSQTIGGGPSDLFVGDSGITLPGTLVTKADLPETLYHVSGAPGIDGVKFLRPSGGADFGGGGLGGGADKSMAAVSLTRSREKAELIQRELIRHGEIAREEAGGDFVNWLRQKVMEDAQAAGISVDQLTPHFDDSVSDFRTRSGFTGANARQDSLDSYRLYLASRRAVESGALENPIIFVTNLDRLRNLTADSVKILEVPRDGIPDDALIRNISGLNETAVHADVLLPEASTPRATAVPGLDADRFSVSNEDAMAAAQTQRGRPEHKMLEIQNRRILPAVLSDLIEHVGDIAHRAQETSGIAIINVREKVNKVLGFDSPSRLSIQDEVDQSWLSNAEFKVFMSDPNFVRLGRNSDARKAAGFARRSDLFAEYRRNVPTAEIEAEAARNEIASREAMLEYVESHEKHNKPITRMGQIGKDMAIHLGRGEYRELTSKAKELDALVSQYEDLASSGNMEAAEALRLRSSRSRSVEAPTPRATADPGLDADRFSVSNVEGERLSAVPLAPGTAPIPDGHFRFFHYTAADPNAIGREGIDISFARGHLDSEPDQIWATTKAPDKVFKTFVEFSLPPDDPRIGGTIGRKRLGIDAQATFTGSINPEDVIAVHERWHDQYRWIMNNPKKLKEVLEGKHDRLLTEDSPAGRATAEIKNSARSEERLSAVPGLDADKFSIAPKGHVAYLNMNDPSSLDQRPHYSEELRERSRDIARGYIDGDKLSANNERVVNPIAEESNSPVDRAYDVLQRTVIGVNDERSFFTKMQDMFSDLSDPVKRKEWFQRWRIKYIDKWDFLEKLTKAAALRGKDNRDLLASTNAHSLALLSDRANSVTAAAINNGVLVLRGGIARVDYSKKGLRDSLAPLFAKDKNLYRTWSLWMIANRSARLIKNNTLTNMTAGEIKVVNDRIKSEGLLPLFEGVKNDYETWNNYVVDFLKDTGVLNDELAVVFKKYSDYIPFYKNMDIDGEGEAGVSPDMFKQILKAENIDLSLGANRRLNTLFPTLTGQKPPSKLKGGSHQIVDPLVGIMQNLRAAVTSGMKNIASVQVLKDAKLVGMATELTTPEEIKTAMYTVRVNGEEKYYNVSDPLLIETLTGFMDGKVKVYPWLSGPAQWLRESVTRSPMFMIRNIQRDSMSAWVTSGFKATPFISTIDKFQGTLRGMSGDEKTYNTLEGAGVVGGFDYVFEPKKFEADFRKKLRRSGITPKKDGTFFDSTVVTVWDKLAEVSNKSDSATRQVVYEDTLQNLLSKGVSRVEAESEAIFQAMEVLNFSRRGNSNALRMIAATVPFLNARIQGIDVMYRAMRGQYSSNRKGKLEAQRSFLARGGIIAMATLALAYANNDSEEYKGASDYEQDNFWIIPMPFGLPALKIPIPFEVGLAFKTFPERSARVLLGDELTGDLADTTFRAVFSTLEVPMFGPQTTLPLLEVIANHNLFTGRPVESPFLSGKPSEERFNRYTTELAKYAGEKSGFSPIKIQHLIDGYAGTVGSYIVGSTAWLFRQATDAPTVPAWRVDQIPVIGSTFQSAESAQGQISEWTEFYYSVNGIASTIKHARRAKDTKRVKRLKRENKKILAVMPKLNRINDKMNKLRTKEDKIWNSRTMDKDKKRDELNKIDRRRKVLLADVKEYRKLKANSFPLFRGILD